MVKFKKSKSEVGRTSFADDLTASLSIKLKGLLRRVDVSPSPTPSTSSLTAARAPPAQIKNRLEQLQAATISLSNADNTPDALAALLDQTFPAFQGLDAAPLSDQTEQTELLLIAQVAVQAYGLAVETLISDAQRLSDEDEYWAGVEGSRRQTALFLLQTTPSRLVSLAATCVTRLRALTPNPLDAPSARAFPSFATIRQTLPPSLLITSMFPHLTAHKATGSSVPHRRLLYLTFSPLLLTREQVTLTRKGIKKALKNLAGKLGTLSQSVNNAVARPLDEEGLGAFVDGSSNNDEVTSSYLLSSTYVTLRQLDLLFSPSPTLPEAPPSTPADLAHSIHYFLTLTLPNHSKRAHATQEDVRRPPWITRNWIGVVGIPVGLWVVAKTVYNSKDTLQEWIATARQTVHGFVVDWVMTPALSILDTIRGGDSGLALMPKESLHSDLESLQRMVVAFGKDQLGVTGEAELQQLAERVKVGDLGSVMRVWESDIKSPIKSAVTGSLIRTLLIQIQKVKVDMLVMVEGVEKMLHSQQLTFGFVGVAPSILILYATSSWLRGWFTGEGARGKENKRLVRKRCWTSMRHLDALLSPSSSSVSKVDATPSAETQGFVILSLASLRTYALDPRQFPTSDTQLRDAFLDDVRALEGGAGSKGVDRLWRWSPVLGWDKLLG